jgi:hypothetical protein
VGVGRAARRLVELRKPTAARSSKLHVRCRFAATAMAVRKASSADAGGGGVALEQVFAAHPMQFRFKCAMAHEVARRERFVEDGDGAVGIARPGFSLG